MFALRLLGYLALVVPSDAGVSPGIGGTAFALVGPLEIGASAAFNGRPFAYEHVGVGGHLGLRAPFERVEIDAAATLGYGHTRNGAGGVLSSDAGATGGSPFVGARGGVEYVIVRTESGKAQVGIALIASYEHDLDQRVEHYEYDEANWLGDWDGEPDPPVEDSTRIGMDRAAVQVAVSIGIN